MGGYVTVMGMMGLQFHYAVLAIFTRAALLDGLTPTVFVAYRQGIATLALAPMIFSPKRIRYFKSSLGLRSLSLMFVTSLIGVTANQNAYFQGLYYASSTAATAMSNLIPAFTFVIAAILGFEKFDLRSIRSMAKILGTVCCVSGALTMALLKGHKLLHMEFVPSIHLTSLTAASGDHLLSTFWMCLFATTQSAIFALLFEQDLQAWILPSPLQLSCCLYAGIGIAVSFFVQSWCISERGPLYCAMFNPLATVITALISATFLKEELYVGSLIGAVGVITGLYIVLWGKAKDFEGSKQEAPVEEPLLSEKSEHVAESKMKMEPC